MDSAAKERTAEVRDAWNKRRCTRCKKRVDRTSFAICVTCQGLVCGGGVCGKAHARECWAKARAEHTRQVDRCCREGCGRPRLLSLDIHGQDKGMRHCCDGCLGSGGQRHSGWCDGSWHGTEENCFSGMQYASDSGCGGQEQGGRRRHVYVKMEGTPPWELAAVGIARMQVPMALLRNEVRREAADATVEGGAPGKREDTPRDGHRHEKDPVREKLNPAKSSKLEEMD